MAKVIETSSQHKTFKRHHVEHQRQHEAQNGKHRRRPWVPPTEQSFQSLSLSCYVTKQSLRPPRKRPHPIVPDPHHLRGPRLGRTREGQKTIAKRSTCIRIVVGGCTHLRIPSNQRARDAAREMQLITLNQFALLRLMLHT
ncbi:hypothetical protein Ahy_A10g047162 [Arachis hypogaea]|uniref:Uncharacterized protein n=1 Tax=Arachis hypogaea TaxID=3818 RepID=A0A445B1V7_ARAHY|nr:hypothetical protein Ahy_A10g047162 [Arachis hypogaea]